MRRTKEDAEKTRRAILCAAEQLFVEKGVAHTSLDIIARKAGVTRGAVYWHFENKARLFNELLSQVRLPPEYLATLLAGEDTQGSLRLLRNHCVELIGDLARNAQKRRIFTILLHRCEFTEELREAEQRHNSFINQYIALSEALFAKAKEQGALRSGQTPPLAARALHALMVGLISDWLRDPALFDPQKDAAALLDALFAGLLKDWDGGAG